MRLVKLILIALIIFIIPDDCLAQSMNVLSRSDEEWKIKIAETDIYSNLTTALKLYELDKQLYDINENMDNLIDPDTGEILDEEKFQELEVSLNMASEERQEKINKIGDIFFC